MSFSITSFAKMCALTFVLVAGAASSAMAETRQAVHDRIENLLGSADDFDLAFDKLKMLFADPNSEALYEISGLVEFPLAVNGGEGDIVIKDDEAFINQIDEIFPENVRNAVVNQRYEDLSVSSDGVMFGNGELWLNVICQDNACSNSYWALTAINR